MIAHIPFVRDTSANSSIKLVSCAVIRRGWFPSCTQRCRGPRSELLGSNRNPPHTLDSLFACRCISNGSPVEFAVSPYLRKLGWPGVCELGAGVPLVLPAPSAACGDVSSLMAPFETDMSCNCSWIDSSPTDGSQALVEGMLVLSKCDHEEIKSVACAVGRNRSSKA